MNSNVKPTILTSGDRALGLGDGFLLAPALLKLSKIYNVRHIATNQSYNILKLIDNGNDLRIFNMDTQGQFYVNDHIAACDLVYWEVRNSLRKLGAQALNVVMELAGLSHYNEVLPDIPIPADIESGVLKFYKELNGPIVVTQSFMSYWNKMITAQKQVNIVNALIDKGYTVLQVTGPGLPPEFLSKRALSFVGKTSILQTMAMIKHADVFLGCDSFGQHCAGFMKTPSVVMFCGTSPEDFGYPYAKNIFHPDVAFCQNKCGRPQRWLYDYSYKDKNLWNTRNEAGWVCPNKICERAITVDEVVSAIDEQLKIGRDRDWTFYNYKHFG